MVEADLALGALQLVALAFPAYTILIQLMVQSELPYANEVVTAISGSFGLLVLGGIIVLTTLVFSSLSLIMQAAVVNIDLGLLGMIAGIGLRTERAQESATG